MVFMSGAVYRILQKDRKQEKRIILCIFDCIWNFCFACAWAEEN